MRFSMEIPSAYLERWAPMTDLDFALAHRVLEDDRYASWYRNRPVDRQLILDNSMHELGEPLPIAQLREAAERVAADFVVPPDQLGKPDWNLDQYKKCVKEFRGTKHSITAVLCGRDRDERKKFLKAVDMAAMLMLPYREPRMTWYLELRIQFERFPWIHLLGVSELSELQSFNRLCGNNERWSIDTSKPVKAGLVGRSILDGQSLRGIPVSSKDLLGLENLSEDQQELIEANVTTFRSICHGELSAT
jgi:hypothetical protein